MSNVSTSSSANFRITSSANFAVYITNLYYCKSTLETAKKHDSFTIETSNYLKSYFTHTQNTPIVFAKVFQVLLKNVHVFNYINDFIVKYIV